MHGMHIFNKPFAIPRWGVFKIPCSLNRLAMGFMALGLGWWLSLVTWQLWAIFTEPASQSSINRMSPAQELTVPQLFGSVSAADRGPVSGQFPTTTLPLILTGLVMSQHSEQRLAVVSYQGKQASYSEGDRLPPSGVALRQIAANGVVLAQPGGLHWLAFNGKDASPVIALENAAFSPDIRQQLVKNPLQITDYITVSPVREGAKTVGYRINPGRKHTVFNKLGFKPDDIAITLNGVDLRDDNQAREIIMKLPELQAVTVVVEREGQRHELHITLDEVSP